MKRRSLYLLAALFFVAGCGRGNFLGRRLDDFGAYYNTFYNAQNTFEDGVDGLERTDQHIDRTRYLPLFANSERAAQTQPFDEAIKKGADVLRDHPDSKWVDNALLLIGQSYFYLQNFVGAEQKFREIITLNQALTDEARFWLARTLIASGQYDAATDHLQETLNRDGLSRRWQPMLRLALGELYVKRALWEEAAVALEEGLSGVREKRLAARAQFLLGQVYETLGRYGEAVEAFGRVRSHNPSFELSFAARVSAIRVEGRHGEAQEAFRQLRRMERDDKNYEYRAELAYLRGQLYQAQGRPEEALDTYYDLLYDSDASIASVQGNTYYALAEIYRDVYQDFPYAAAYFDSAATVLTRPQRPGVGQVGAEAFAPVAITDAQDQARVFLSFARVMSDIERKDSLLYVGSLDEEAFDAFVLEVRQRRAEELAAQRREIERREVEQLFNANAGVQGARGQAAAATQNTDFGFLLHKSTIQMEEGRLDFVQQWGDRPLVPNWRRLEAVAGATTRLEPGQQPGVVAQEGSSEPGAGLPEVDLSEVPRDEVSQRRMRAARAVARYELANVLFLSMNRPDSAAVWYRMVVEEDTEEPVAQRAYYALAEVQRALGDDVSANRLYQVILERYPTSEFAGRAQERLGLEVTQAVVVDSTALAEMAYAQAYGVWRQEDYARALNALLNVALTYPYTNLAPRALFAAGSVYMEWAARDSLSLFAPLPVEIPDSLLKAQGLLTEVSPADTTASMRPDTRGSGFVPPDSLGGTPPPAPDSLSVPDSLAPPDRALSDSLVATTATRPPEAALRLSDLYTRILSRYPQAPQAMQARQVLTGLEERRLALEAPPDSLALGDSLSLAEAGARSDTLATEQVTDSLAMETAQREQLRRLLDQRQADAVPSPTDDSLDVQVDTLATPKEAPLEGFSLIVASATNEAEADVLLARHRAPLSGQGYEVDLLAETIEVAGRSLTRYRIGVGPFATRADALQARERLGEALPKDAWIFEISPNTRRIR